MKLHLSATAIPLASLCLASATPGLRTKANRVRTIADFSSSIRWIRNQDDASGLLEDLENEEKEIYHQEQSLMELMDTMAAYETGFSMTDAPTSTTSAEPTLSVMPSSAPSPAAHSHMPTMLHEPSLSPRMSSVPSNKPSLRPSISTLPSLTPKPPATMRPTARSPTKPPTPEPTGFLTKAPTKAPTKRPTTVPSPAPTKAPTFAPTNAPSASPTKSSAPSSAPSAPPMVSPAPTSSPTLEVCGITPEQRAIGIMGILDQFADSFLIRDPTTTQGMATQWILNEDLRRLCPQDAKIIQRWALAVLYFSTGGDEWIECFDSDDDCGVFPSEFPNQRAFLSPFHECGWAGISCNVDACVTEIEFEENNLVGTIPTELALFSELAIWGMERGDLTGTIPTQVGQLHRLVFIDLDYNSLTGTLPTELNQLANLTQLDLNNNFLSGSIDGMQRFGEMEFLQLHANEFTGTIPSSIGSFIHLSTFTLHETMFGGTMPDSVCSLVGVGGLTSLIADCDGIPPDIVCDCCTDCRDA